MAFFITHDVVDTGEWFLFARITMVLGEDARTTCIEIERRLYGCGEWTVSWFWPGGNTILCWGRAVILTMRE